MSCSIATLGMFVGKPPNAWVDKGTGGGGGATIYRDKKLPIVRLNKVNKKINIINIYIDKIEET